MREITNREIMRVEVPEYVKPVPGLKVHFIERPRVGDYQKPMDQLFKEGDLVYFKYNINVQEYFLRKKKPPKFNIIKAGVFNPNYNADNTAGLLSMGLSPAIDSKEVYIIKEIRDYYYLLTHPLAQNKNRLELYSRQLLNLKNRGIMEHRLLISPEELTGR